MSRAERKFSIQITHDSHIYSDTIGQILGSLDNLSRFQKPWTKVPTEMVGFIEKTFGGEQWSDNLEINFNHSPLMRQMKRAWQKEERRANLFVRRSIGLVSTFVTSMWSKTFRRDFYNPFSNSIQLFHPQEALVAKQLGMALEHDRSDNVTRKVALSGFGVVQALGLNAWLFPVAPLAISNAWKASRSALEHMPEADRPKATKQLDSDFVYDALGGKWVVLPFLMPVVGAYKLLRSHKKVESKLGEKSLFRFNPKKQTEVPQFA